MPPTTFLQTQGHARGVLLMESTIGRRVGEWFRQFPGECFCDQCIAAKIASPDIGKVHYAATRIGAKSGASRYRGQCSVCKSVRVVTIVDGTAPV
jgi:hypothetical protein